METNVELGFKISFYREKSKKKKSEYCSVRSYPILKKQNKQQKQTTTDTANGSQIMENYIGFIP